MHFDAEQKMVQYGLQTRSFLLELKRSHVILRKKKILGKKRHCSANITHQGSQD
jgi:hypothetical protein